MKAPRLVITRPEPEATRWVSALAAHGLEAVALPLIAINPVQSQALDDARRDLAAFDALMFVSPAAANAFFAQSVCSSHSTRFLATGPGTERVLKAQGIAESLIDAPPADAPQFDSEALWRVIASRHWQGKRVLIVRGQTAGADASTNSQTSQGTGRDWLTRQFEMAGATVQLVAAYQRALPQWSVAQRQQAESAMRDGSVWVFSSTEAVQHLAQLLPQSDWSSLPCICTHERIAQTTQALGFERIQICKPSLEAIAALCHAQ